ncbi:hypothetical protein AB4144_47325 [Rhizobiaceae sp. 2RAB30]
MSEPLLTLENITKSYGAIEALKGISFSIAKGEVVAGDVARNRTSPDAVIGMITGETLAGAGPAG